MGGAESVEQEPDATVRCAMAEDDSCRMPHADVETASRERLDLAWPNSLRESKDIPVNVSSCRKGSRTVRPEVNLLYKREELHEGTGDLEGKREQA